MTSPLLRLFRALAEPEEEIRKQLVDRENLRVSFTRRPRAGYMGRFGGGWQWSLGLEAGGRREGGRQTIIINLLVCYLRVSFGPRPERRG